MGLDTRLIPFRVATSDAGGSVTIDGHDVTDKCGALTVQLQAGRPAALTLYGVADGAIDTEGVVYVKSDLDVREQIAAFLDAIDPAELDRVTLEEARRGLTDSLTPVMLAVLRRWAVGQ